MQLRTVERKHARIRALLQGPSGSGKSYSSLLFAFGLTNDWRAIAVIDTENHAAHLYAHLGTYQVLTLEAPFSPERYMEAITTCEQAGMQVIIIDSISHEWNFILENHGATTGNSYTNWNKFTPRHDALVQALLQSNCHLIATARAKQDYVLSEKNGKQVPEKVGMKAITREGMDYEFTLVMELDSRHSAKVSKDRTGLFAGKPEFIISPQTGTQILQWCQLGTSQEDVQMLIRQAPNLTVLRELYTAYPDFRSSLAGVFTQRKEQIQLSSQPQFINGQHGNPTPASES